MPVVKYMRIGRFLRFKRITKAKETEKIIKCSYDTLKQHIIKQFKPNMTWQLFLEGKIHLDHIKPLCTAKNIKELYKLFYYKNIQPMWARENYKKITKDILCKNANL